MITEKMTEPTHESRVQGGVGSQNQTDIKANIV